MYIQHILRKTDFCHFRPSPPFFYYHSLGCKIPLLARALCIQDTLSSRARLAGCACEQRYLAYKRALGLKAKQPLGQARDDRVFCIQALQ